MILVQLYSNLSYVNFIPLLYILYLFVYKYGICKLYDNATYIIFFLNIFVFTNGIAKKVCINLNDRILMILVR